MFLDKIVIILLEITLVIFLLKKYISKKVKINLVIIPIIIFLTGVYIFFTIRNINIPIYLQIIYLFFSLLIPTFFIFIEYSNIILKKQFLYYKINNSFKNREYLKTISYIEKVMMLYEKKASLYYILGECYKNLNDYINSRDSFALAVDLDKNDYKSYYELALVLDETNKKEVAIVMFNKALKIKPDFYEAHEGLGICYTSQGKFREAVNVYTSALKYHPDSYEFYYNIGMIELELKEYEASKEAFKKSGELKKDLYMAHYNLGKIYYLNGEYDEAIEAYKKILCSNTYGPRGYYQIAQVYAAKKEYEKAMSSLEYAVELNPSYLKEIEDEFIFTNMKDMVKEYIKNREELNEKQRQKHNYMRNISSKFNIFKNKEEYEYEILNVHK